MMPNIVSALSKTIAVSVTSPSSATSLRVGAVQSSLIDLLDSGVRANLQGFSQDLYDWVIISAWVVALGCVFEGPELFFELWPGLFAWFTWSSSIHHDKFERRIKVAGLLGWVLIILGVASEGVFEAVQNRAEGQLQIFNDTLLADARLTATRAKQSAFDAADAAHEAKKASESVAVIAYGANQTAANARIAAEDADAQATSASNISGESKVKAEAAGKAADALNAQLAATEAKLKDVEAKRAKLEQSLVDLAVCNAPRTFRAWYIGPTSYVEALKPFKGVTALLTHEANSESERAARYVETALKAAGWTVVQTPLRKDEFIPAGVSVMTNGRNDHSSASQAFVTWLHQNNWQATNLFFLPSNETDIGPNMMKILVGLYPDGSLIVSHNDSQAMQVFDSIMAEHSEDAMDAASLQRLNDRIKDFTPDKQAQERSLYEKFRQAHLAERATAMKDEEQPCRPLSGLSSQP